MHLKPKRLILDADGLDRMLKRMATQIHESVPDSSRLAFVGIQTRGVPLANRLHALFPEAMLGELDITLYRDDLTIIAPNPVVHRTDIPGSVDGLHVLLIDDVLFTGRTARAAIDNLLDYGRPATIRLVVLVDRGHRELPIQGDFVGRVIPTERDEIVEVRLKEVDGEDGVWIMEMEKEEK